MVRGILQGQINEIGGSVLGVAGNVGGQLALQHDEVVTNARRSLQAGR
jgi:hypothetical protein